MVVWQRVFSTDGGGSLPSGTSCPASAPQEWRADRSAGRSGPPLPSHLAPPCVLEPDNSNQSVKSIILLHNFNFHFL